VARFDGSELDLKGACKARDDVVLHLQQFALIGVELVRPEVSAGLGVDQLAADEGAAGWQSGSGPARARRGLRL